MESWEGYNYYTTNATAWVQLMNYSTAEFGLGYFPPSIVAIPGALNGSYHFSNSTYVIQYAGRADSDNRATEKIVFGIVSAIAIAFALIWLWFNRKTLFHPRNSNQQDVLPRANSPTSNYTGTTELTPLQDNKFWGADDFKDQIFNFYYEPVYTEVELFEKSIEDGVETEDIEAVTALLRKMYADELYLWAQQSNPSFTEAQEKEMIDKKIAIQEEIVHKVEEWAAMGPRATVHTNWDAREQKELNALVNLIDRPTQQLPIHEEEQFLEEDEYR